MPHTHTLRHIHTQSQTCSSVLALAHMAINPEQTRPGQAVGLKPYTLPSRQSPVTSRNAAQTKMRIIPAKSLEIWQSLLLLSVSLCLSISLAHSLSVSRWGTKRFAIVIVAFSFSSSYICQANGITAAIATTSKPNKNVICRFAQKSSTQPNNDNNNNSNSRGNSQKQSKTAKTRGKRRASQTRSQMNAEEREAEPEKVVALHGCWPWVSGWGHGVGLGELVLSGGGGSRQKGLPSRFIKAKTSIVPFYTWVVSCELRVASCKLRAASCERHSRRHLYKPAEIRMSLHGNRQ